ncbi:MAG: glycosyltransferase, partial [Alphaproteobacteria bacterium]|nr:glycosyltransferase [Alphaproteobacteria bacterium]
MALVLPTLNEERHLERCLRSLLDDPYPRDRLEILVVDGGSTDRTVARATAAGARAVVERQRGYGLAVQAGIAAAHADADILVFLDGDGSDRPEFIPALIAPIVEGRAVFVHGSLLR